MLGQVGRARHEGSPESSRRQQRNVSRGSKPVARPAAPPLAAGPVQATTCCSTMGVGLLSDQRSPQSSPLRGAKQRRITKIPKKRREKPQGANRQSVYPAVFATRTLGPDGEVARAVRFIREKSGVLSRPDRTRREDVAVRSDADQVGAGPALPLLRRDPERQHVSPKAMRSPSRRCPCQNEPRRRRPSPAQKEALNEAEAWGNVVRPQVIRRSESAVAVCSRG